MQGGGSYATAPGDGPLCSGSDTWTGNADIPQYQSTTDFDGTNDSTNLVYDMRP
jgi:hypothetical protein